MKNILACLILLTTTACAGTVVKDRVVEVSIPVVQDCVAETGRPAKPITFEKQITDLGLNWEEMDVKQKSAATGVWAFSWVDYGQDLHAATGACK
jgi:hypothetical protein